MLIIKKSDLILKNLLWNNSPVNLFNLILVSVMSRSAFLLLLGIYCGVFGVVMLFAASKMLEIYEFPVNEYNIRLMRFMAPFVLSNGILIFIVRNAENSPALRIVLVWISITIFFGVLYQVYVVVFERMNVPVAFWAELISRSIFGCGVLYYLLTYEKRKCVQ